MSKKSISYFALSAMFLIGLFGVCYPYMLISSVIQFAITQPDMWNNHHLMDAGTVIPISWRWIYVALWVPALIATLMMVLSAVYVVNLMRKGIYFDARTIGGLRLVGITASLSSVMVYAGAFLEPWVLTKFNSPETRKGLNFFYDSGETGLFLTGIGVILLAYVLRVATLTDAENKEFV